MSDFYVVMRFVSGEQVMAVLVEEDEENVLLQNPMLIRMILNYEAGKEHITAHPLCHFSEDQGFVIGKENILFCKKLHHTFIPHYRRMVEQYTKTEPFVQNNEWEEEEQELTIEEVQKRIAMLEAIAGAAKADEEPDEDRYRVFIEGNDTIN